MFGQATALTVLLSFTLAAREPVLGGELGKVVDYKFRRPPINALGIASLADLRGKPVLIEFWGTR